MMKSGVPLFKPSDIVGKGAGDPSAGRLLNDIRNDVETGSSLRQSVPLSPSVRCALLQPGAAGEQAGICRFAVRIDSTCRFKEKILAVEGKMKSAMFYRCAVVVVRDRHHCRLTHFRHPRIREGLPPLRSGACPAPTLFVMALSDFLRRLLVPDVRRRGGRPSSALHTATSATEKMPVASISCFATPRVGSDHPQGDDHTLDANAGDNVPRRRRCTGGGARFIIRQLRYRNATPAVQSEVAPHTLCGDAEREHLSHHGSCSGNEVKLGR